MYRLRSAAPLVASLGLRLAVLGMAWALSACATAEPQSEAGYTDRYGAEMFDAGYAYIADRYIEPVSLRKVGVGGLSGLHALDPELSVTARGDIMTIRYSGKPVATMTLPVSDRPETWSSLTVDAVSVARKSSPLIAEAPAEDVFKAVFDGMLAPLDEFSRYDGAESATERRAFREGFGGIGITIRMEERDAVVLTVMEDGPAARAGLLAEDRMTHVDREPVAGWTQHDLVEALRGREGSDVTVTLRREGVAEPIRLRMTRRHVVPDTATLRRVGDIPVLRVTAFNEKTAAQLDHLIDREMRDPEGPPQGFILDLRSNPGGLLDVAIAVADIFLESGVVVKTAGRHPGSVKSFGASKGDSAAHLPVVILINGNSASASEIVTAALQDNGRAVVIGTNSYGKGTVQSVLGLPNNGEMSLTWSRFLAPSGYRLHHLGILPSICSHGGGIETSAEALLARLRSGDGTLSSRLSAWRATGNVSEADRESLRTLCPVDGSSPDVDVALAQALIADRPLYNRIVQAGQTSIANR